MPADKPARFKMRGVDTTIRCPRQHPLDVVVVRRGVVEDVANESCASADASGNTRSVDVERGRDVC